MTDSMYPQELDFEVVVRIYRYGKDGQQGELIREFDDETEAAEWFKASGLDPDGVLVECHYTDAGARIVEYQQDAAEWAAFAGE